jgi:hypothetical protein
MGEEGAVVALTLSDIFSAEATLCSAGLGVGVGGRLSGRDSRVGNGDGVEFEWVATSVVEAAEVARARWSC